MVIPVLNQARRPAPTASTLLFERLPDRLFAPLASTNRQKFWALLCRLHTKRFGPDAPLPPSKGFSIREITQDIQEELATQDVWELEEGIQLETPLDVRSAQVMSRLVDTGWLRLEKIGVEKRVSMRPAVNQVLTTLISFAETGPVFLSGKIRSIDLNIQQVIEGKADGDTLSETAEQARHLIEHVRNTGTNVRDIMESLSKEITTADYVRRFFNDYIEQVFIGDYRELRTKEHPLSKRQQIIRAVEDLSSIAQHRERLIGWYELKRCAGNREKAEQLFQKDVNRLLDLSRIDEYLDRLDDEIRRANRRAFAYLDYRLRSLRPIDLMVKQAIASLLNDKAETISDPFPPGLLMSGDRLAEPRKAIARAEPTSLRKVAPSFEKIARSNLMMRAREARTMTPPKLAEFVSGRLGSEQKLGSDKLVISSVTDTRAYQVLAGLAMAFSSTSKRLQLSAAAESKGFLVRLKDESEIDENVISGRAFEIERRVRTKGRVK